MTHIQLSGIIRTIPGQDVREGVQGFYDSMDKSSKSRLAADQRSEWNHKQIAGWNIATNMACGMHMHAISCYVYIYIYVIYICVCLYMYIDMCVCYLCIVQPDPRELTGENSICHCCFSSAFLWDVLLLITIITNHTHAILGQLRRQMIFLLGKPYGMEGP